MWNTSWIVMLLSELSTTADLRECGSVLTTGIMARGQRPGRLQASVSNFPQGRCPFTNGVGPVMGRGATRSKPSWANPAGNEPPGRSAASGDVVQSKVVRQNVNERAAHNGSLATQVFRLATLAAVVSTERSFVGLLNHARHSKLPSRNYQGT